jgi:hypothetical protein
VLSDLIKILSMLDGLVQYTLKVARLLDRQISYLVSVQRKYMCRKGKDLQLLNSQRLISSWIENSTIASRGAGGGITAWKGSPDGYAGVYNNTYGLYVHNSQLIKVS